MVQSGGVSGGGTLDMRRHAAVNRDALGGSLNSRQSQSPAFALALMRKCRLLGSKKKKKNPVTTAAATDVYNLPLASCSSGLQPSLENKLSSIHSDADAMDTHKAAEVFPDFRLKPQPSGCLANS